MRPMPLALCCTLLLASPATTAEERARFDVQAARMERGDALFLDELFRVVEELPADSRRAARWLVSDGARGLGLYGYLDRVGAMLDRLERLHAPLRTAELKSLAAQAIRGQRQFFVDWHAAREEGRPFESQLTSEYGFHDGLHQSHRTLVRLYVRLLVLFPDEDGQHRRAFLAQVRALDLVPGAGR